MLKFEHGLLVFEGKKITPSVRTLAQMRQVLSCPEMDEDMAADAPLYYMYRQAALFSSIRYDITRILPLEICNEHNKTFGHVHPKSPRGAPWPEVYEVLEGEAHFLLQKVSQLGVEDAVLLSAKKGGCLLVPPYYGHVTINPGKKELVLANLVSGNFEADYSMFATRRGACFYEMSDGKLVKNKNYGTGFELRKAEAMEFSSAFACFKPFAKKSLLEAAKKWEDIEFLQNPEHFY